MSAPTRIACTRRIEFDAAHRIVDHESKCKYVHGHRYVVEATFEPEAGLDTLGRVVDFGRIKQVLGAWIEMHWDHTMILWEKDRELGESVAAQTGQDVYYLPFNPTAENMACYLLDVVCPELFRDDTAQCTKISLYETPNCTASAEYKS